MYTIGQISEMFQLPISTLRYYDKEGLFPDLERSSGIRRFSEKEIEALRVIECLKKSGLEIKDIKLFMEWCSEGSATYQRRKELFERQKEIVQKEIAKLEKVLDMLQFKCWYYEQAIREHGFSQAAYVVSTYVGYGRALIAQKKYKSALEKLQIGKEISEKNITSLFRREVYLLLSACYDRLGEPKEALEYYKKYTAESFRLYNEDKERTEKELMVRYETEKRNKELAQKNMLLQKEQNRVMALVGITFVVLIVVLLFYINYRRKNRLYKQIVRESVDWLAKERQFSKRIAEQEKQLQELIGKAGAVDGGRYSGSSLNKDSQQELFGRLERLMQNDQVYKNSLFTREKMAELLGTNRTYLSQTINEQTGLTFTHYMNKYRIEEARRILADPQDDTPIKAIAADLGFSSVTTFYTLFKAVVQMSPDQYRKHARSLRENKS